MSNFEVGSVVQLVSGSPLMTVSSRTATDAKCVWFDQHNRLQTGAFALQFLVLSVVDHSLSSPGMDASNSSEVGRVSPTSEADMHFAEVEAQLGQFLGKSEPAQDGQLLGDNASAPDAFEASPADCTPQSDDRRMILDKLAPLFVPQPPEQHGLHVAPTPKSYLDMVKRKLSPWG